MFISVTSISNDRSASYDASQNSVNVCGSIIPSLEQERKPQIERAGTEEGRKTEQNNLGAERDTVKGVKG